MTDSGAILAELTHSSAIPAESNHSSATPADYSAILVELPDSGWNLWGTEKYRISFPIIPGDQVSFNGFEMEQKSSFLHVSNYVPQQTFFF